MSIVSFNETLATWQIALQEYTFEKLCAVPYAGSWSAGQLYKHLIDDTTFFAEQIRVCVSNNEHVEKKALPFAVKMLADNDFPDQAIEGSPDNAFIPQPESKEQLTKEMEALEINMNDAASQIGTSPFKGKSKHPGLGYFSAEEWLQFAEMHLRHHLRQKKRIDAFLRTF